MNLQLYYSSAIIGAITLVMSIIMYHYNLNMLYQITYIGIITSILNHMSVNTVIKYTDRFVISLATFVYIYFIFLMKYKPIYRIACILIGMAISCYFTSKFCIILTSEEFPDNSKKLATNLHMSAHFLVALILFTICYEYNFYESNQTNQTQIYTTT